MNKTEFIEAVSQLGLKVTSEHIRLLEKYYELLVEWNKKMNLTAITDHDEVYLKHFYDSLTLIRVIDLNHEQSLCDIGTGAGFPGIVLKIFYPHLVLTLVDALNKRIKFLEVVVRELGLEKVTLIHDRAEEYARKNREKFDVVTARAVASLNILLEYSLPLVKVNKHFIAMKGNENTKNSLNALALLSRKIVLEDEFMLPRENAKRNLIKVIKVKETATRYPRKFSEIKKRPL